jgi:hypothetical protein
MIQRRSVATCIVLSIITCGIYALYWLYCLANDVNTVTRDPNALNGGMVLLLSIVTCSIYLLYWMYVSGQKIDQVKASRGIPSGSTGILYLLLTFFGLGIIAYALMQDELNKLAM